MESDSDDEEKEAQEARKEEQRPTYEVTQPTPGLNCLFSKLASV